MLRLFACIISPDIQRDETTLKNVAGEFSYLIEKLDDGILFDVSGLERLMGDRKSIADKVKRSLSLHGITGSVAVADTIDSACLLARQTFRQSLDDRSSIAFSKLPLSDLPIEQDTLKVFHELGLRQVDDLLQIPHKELITRYGKDFQKIIDIAEEKGSSLISPNLKEHFVVWRYDLDQPVQDFEQLIFLLNHGFERLFATIRDLALSTEQLDIAFDLIGTAQRVYEIKTSFPTLERAFWLKLVNLRVSLDPPDSEIIGVKVTAHFTKPRPSQMGLYAVSRPEPENLLLTVNKLKKLVGEDNVGLPVVLNQRILEPFKLNADGLPAGMDSTKDQPRFPSLAFTYYRPPHHAEVVYRDGQLIFIRTRQFDGYVREYSGVWKGNSCWWDKPWGTQEWDVEVENQGIYRLCKVQKEWFLLGEYD